MKMKRGKSSTAGITLVALVVTLVVLLILAGITIVYAFGDNGIFQRATDAKAKTEKATIQERIQMEISDVQVANRSAKVSKSELKTILEKYFTDVPANYTIDTELTAKEEYGSHTMKVSEVYGGSFAPNGGISGSDIVNAEDKSEYYGAIVKGYECPNSAGVNNWKIFYADESNIYLIADDYIHYDYCPPSKTQTVVKNSNYKLGMDNIIKDYTGSANITDPKIQNLNKSYFDYLKTNTSTNNNMKAVAYMTDTNVWKVYAGAKAEYAIGGPTLEMLFASYNQKHNTQYQAKATSNTGYQLSTDGGKTWKYDTTTASEYLDTDDSLYVIKETTKANAMWVASPSAYNTANVMFVAYNGVVDFNSYNANAFGFRPLVCLGSDVRLEKNEDGTFEIK